MAIKTIYHFTALTGGAATALDSVDGNSLLDLDRAFVIASSIFYIYELDTDSGAAESSPDVISPDTNAGTKRWILITTMSITAVTTSITAADNTSTTAIATTAFAKSQDAVLHRDPDQGVAMTAAASGSSGITVADDDDIDFGTGNFALVWKGSLPDWTPAADVILLQKITGGVGYQLDLLTTGYLELTLNALTFATTSSVSATNGTAHEISVTISVGATQTTVSFYVDGVLLQTPAAQNNTTTVSSAAVFYALGTSAVRTAGTVHHAYTLNFAPSAAEILDAYRNGIPELWKWGSQTSLVTGDNSTFASDTGFWTKEHANITIAAGVASFASVPANNGMYNTTVLAATIGKKVRITYTTSGYTEGTIRPAYGGVDLTDRTSNGTFTEEITPITTAGLYFIARVATTTVNIDNVTLVPLGATFALGPESWQQDNPYDLSSNNLTCSYPTVGWTLTKPPVRKIKQPSPTAKTTTATLTIAELLTGLLTGTHAAGATQAYTLPTGTLCDAWPAFGINDYFDWILINLSAAAADTITVTAGADHTLVGEGIVQSAHASTGQLYGNSAKFRTRKTAANTFVTYRIG